jgi:hypothetical protein
VRCSAGIVYRLTTQAKAASHKSDILTAFIASCAVDH